MTMSKKALTSKTTYSKWQKGDIRRVYLNSPILRYYGVKFYFDGGSSGYCVPHQTGKIFEDHRFLVISRFWQNLVEKGIADKDRTYLDFEMFDTLWNKL